MSLNQIDQKYSFDDSAQQDDIHVNNGPVGLGGWMAPISLLFLAQYVLILIDLLGYLHINIKKIDQPHQITNLELGVYFVISTLFILMFFKKHRLFPKTASIWLTITAVTNLFNWMTGDYGDVSKILLLFFNAFDYVFSVSLTSHNFIKPFSIFFCMVLIMYFKTSKRVQNTFIEN